MIDLEQARRRAKERLTTIRAGDPSARLTQAQHLIATELGQRSWPDLVRTAEAFDLVAPDDLAWSRIRRVSIVCFLEHADDPDGAVVTLYADQPGTANAERSGHWRLPSGRRLPTEDVWDDSVLRIPLETMGFRRQGTHLLAVDHDRRHCVFWVDGGRYSGARAHRTDAAWWTGSAAEASALLSAQGDQALSRLVDAAAESRRTMSYDQHAADLRRTLVGTYLRAETAEGGSGFGGTPQDWRDAREVLADAVDATRDRTTFLDLTCANGHLAASMVDWAAERGVALAPYGVDIAPELVERAALLHPELAGHVWTGDALTWRHPDGLRFDLVHMLLDVIPAARHGELVDHLLTHVVAPGGRLLLSQYGEILVTQNAESVVTRLGYAVAGRTREPHRRDLPRGYPSVWIDA